MKNKALKYFLIGLAVFVAIIVIEFCCIYAVERENIWNYLNEYWDWYWNFILHNY